MVEAAQKKRTWRRLRWARRASQAVFLALFLWLIGVTASVTGAAFDAASSAKMQYPVEAFLDIDPLAGAMVLLSTRTIPETMLFGLIVLGSAILLGRAFCGWVCPMGTMNHLAWRIAPGLKGKRLIEANRTRPYQKIKYVVLAVVLAAALFGSALGGLLDPLCLATRGISLTFLPWIQWAFGSSIDAAMKSNLAQFQHAADSAYDLLDKARIYQRGTIAAGGVLISIFFVAVLAANRFVPRFWCRGVCPLGALLGLVGRWGVLSLHKDKESCRECKKCQLLCSGAASPRPQDRWQRSECDLCLNCVASCNTGSVGVGLARGIDEEQPWPDLKRRSVLVGAAAGAVMVPAMRTGSLDSPAGRPDPACIRPPGAVGENDFLKRCIRCAQCMKICPNNALHPALDESGVEGLWTPVLVPRIGYCEPTCTLCTQVCPTGAIKTVTEAQKLGQGGRDMVRIGTAFIDRGRCLPWAMGTSCVVCEEFCPTSPKAIWFNKEKAELRSQTVEVKRPNVDPAQCNGCGACEYVCPVHDKAAIVVTSAGESRSPGHAVLLKRASDKKRSD